MSKKDKKKNKELSSERIIIEHTNQKLKVFKILSERYRNRRKRFALRFNLIAGFYNYELKLKIISKTYEKEVAEPRVCPSLIPQ